MIELAVVKLDDVLAHVVKEIAVVCHHKDGQPLLAQKLFQPFNHSYVEVVGRLVEQQQIGVVDEYPAQRHLLLLAAA